MALAKVTLFERLNRMTLWLVTLPPPRGRSPFVPDLQCASAYNRAAGIGIRTRKRERPVAHLQHAAAGNDAGESLQPLGWSD